MRTSTEVLVCRSFALTFGDGISGVAFLTSVQLAVFRMIKQLFRPLHTVPPRNVWYWLLWNSPNRGSKFDFECWSLAGRSHYTDRVYDMTAAFPLTLTFAVTIGYRACSNRCNYGATCHLGKIVINLTAPASSQTCDYLMDHNFHGQIRDFHLWRALARTYSPSAQMAAGHIQPTIPYFLE